MIKPKVVEDGGLRRKSTATGGSESSRRLGVWRENVSGLTVRVA